MILMQSSSQKHIEDTDSNMHPFQIPCTLFKTNGGQYHRLITYMKLIPTESSEPCVLFVAKLQTIFDHYPTWGSFWEAVATIQNHIMEASKNGGSKSEDLFLGLKNSQFVDCVNSGDYYLHFLFCKYQGFMIDRGRVVWYRGYIDKFSFVYKTFHKALNDLIKFKSWEFSHKTFISSFF